MITPLVMPNEGRAQSRAHETHRPGEPEGQLMVYYASVLANSPAGLILPAGTRAFVGLDATYVPPLSRERRAVQADKPETTNLARGYPRLRGLVAFGPLTADAAWVPAVPVFGVRASIIGLAVSGVAASWRAVRFSPRVSALVGRVEGPFTCNAATASDEGQSLEVYYANVCHGNDSRDRFEPQRIALELGASTTRGRITPYVMAGMRHERATFDIGVIRADGSRDPDHPILDTRITKGYGATGATWAIGGRAVVSGELFYAPGTVLTARAAAGVRVR
jgi:hypothetical protein